jgi:hypothetical protein
MSSRGRCLFTCKMSIAPRRRCPWGAQRLFRDRRKSLRRRRTRMRTTTPPALPSPKRLTDGPTQDTNRETALSTRVLNVRGESGDECGGVFVSVRAARQLSRLTGLSCRKRSSEQPKQVRLELAFYPHPHSLPIMAPRHHPHISPHAAWNASLLCAVCIFWLSKVFDMRLEALRIRGYRRAILGGWRGPYSSSSMPCSGQTPL